MWFTILKIFVDFSFLRNMEEYIGNDFLKKFFLCSDSVNMLKPRVVAAVRVVINHSKFTPLVFPFVFMKVCFTPLSLLCTSKVATEMRIQKLTVLRNVINFVLSFRQLLIFRRQWNSLILFLVKYSFPRWKPFCFIFHSLIGNWR